MSTSDRSYTKDQQTIVEKILKHKAHEYYEILEIEKSASENEIKKAYRKVSLKVHPDKNSHPKADESFKRVAKAFEVLSDPQKRNIYDQTGSDPDSRGGSSGGASPADFASAFGGAGGSHPFFQGGPFAFGGGAPQGFQFQGGQGADLFDILFGQGAQMGGTSFTFGGPGGVRFATNGSPFGFGGQRDPRQQRQRQQPQGQHANNGNPNGADFFQTIKQYLPILIFLIIPIISNLFADTQEKFSFEKREPYLYPKVSSHFQVPYYVTQKQAANLSPQKLSRLDREAEHTYVSKLKESCRRETSYKEHQIEDAYGWFFTDEESLLKAKNLRLPNCEKLQQLGLSLL